MNPFNLRNLWIAFLHPWLLLPGDLFHIRQEVAEFPVVDLYAVVEVEADALVGGVTELFVEGAELVELLAQKNLLLTQLVLRHLTRQQIPVARLEARDYVSLSCSRKRGL